MGLLIGIVCISITSSPASADLRQFGDAMADVVTFGAWGQSRDLADLEIERLKLRFQEDLKRAKNKSDALVSTTRIEEKAQAAINARYTGQSILKVVAGIDVLLAQHKQLIVERFEIDKNVGRFEEWFDKFVGRVDDQLGSLAELVKLTAKGDDRAMNDALEAAKLARVQSKADVEQARKHLRAIFGAARSSTVVQAMGELLAVRAELTKLLEYQRGTLARLVTEMAAEDKARRTLCDPQGVIGVGCDKDGKACRYYSPDKDRPLPCDDLVYLNGFPVAAIKAIYDDLESYRSGAEFFVRLEMLGTVGPISQTAFRSPKEIFGDALAPAALLPKEFLMRQECAQVSNYRARLLEAFDVVAIFDGVQTRTPTTRRNVAEVRSLRRSAEFWLDGLQQTIPKATSCSAMSPRVREKLRTLVRAISALESFGSAIANNNNTLTNNPKSLEPLRRLAADF